VVVAADPGLIGYIETYLNLGVLGVILIGVIVVTFRKITRQLRTNLDFASWGLRFYLRSGSTTIRKLRLRSSPR
jgi:hypothetical protein